jgi:hypothetical protein
MLGFTLKAQRPPKPKRVKEGVIMRLDHVYEIDPARMQVFRQQEMAVWDTQRIVKNRWEHLAWMHDHFADSVISGEELQKESLLERVKRPGRGKRETAKGRKKFSATKHK